MFFHNKPIYIVAYVFFHIPMISFEQFYLLLQVAFPIQKRPYFSQLCVYFPKYNEKNIYLFPNVKAQVAFQNQM